MDHPISEFFKDDKNFSRNSKEECSKTGTTEEAIARADKIGFKTDIVAINPLDENIKVPVYFFTKFCIDGLWIWSSVWLPGS